MRLRTLGELRLEGSGFTRPKPLLLLAHLVIEGPQRRRHLAELFWPDARDGMKSLGVALARLRTGAPGAVDADDRSAWATVACDARTFLDLLDRGAEEEALALYGGGFVDGVLLRWGAELEEWVYRTREAFAGRAYRAQLDLAAVQARRGRFERAAAHAERARRIGGTLVEPEDLGRLHAFLLAGGSPQAADARREAGELGVPIAATAREARGRLRAGAAFGGLPARGAAFVGREEEIARASAFLARPSGRLLTLVGPAGVGKSRLALEIARRQSDADRFADGVHVVPLEAAISAEAVLPAIADAVGVPAAADDLRRRLSDELEGAEILLVLDGVDRLTEASDDLAELLRRLPRLRLLAVSRSRLHLEAERFLPLSGLPFPADGTATPAEAWRFDAVRLFERRARRADPDFVLDGRNLADVVRVCRAVDGFPLGIELAAAWVRVLPPREIAEEIDRGLDFPTARTLDVPPRHRSLRRAFEHAWSRLSERERRVLRRASVFHGGFRREAARVVAGADLPLLASLVDASLVRVDRSGRYDRQPLVHQYAREKAAARPTERREAEERHARHLLGRLVDRSEDLEGPARGEAVAALEEESDNLRVAWRRAAAHGWTDLLHEACRPLQVLLLERGAVREGERLFGDAAGRLDPDDRRHRPLLARFRVAEGLFRVVVGEDDGGERAARAGLALARGPGSRHGAAAAEARRRTTIAGGSVIGRVASDRGDAEGAARAYRQALAAARADGEPADVAALAVGLALARRAAGRREEAERLAEEALALDRRRGDARAVARDLRVLRAARAETGASGAAYAAPVVPA